MFNNSLKMTHINLPSQSTSPIVLMYHATPLNNPKSRYSIRADRFSKHLDYLKKQAWHTALFNELNRPKSLPNKTVLLTFDDGYADNYENAFLPLLDHDMKATWFITTDCIGEHALWMGDKTAETRMLSSNQLKEMNQQGMEIASHTCSHPDLSTLPYSNQLKELKQSKETLESIISEKISSFAYPYGRYNQDSIKAVEQTGYTQACSVRSGFYRNNENPFLIRRVTIFDTDTVSTLARKLIFAENDVSWSHLSHYYLQRIKHKLHL